MRRLTSIKPVLTAQGHPSLVEALQALEPRMSQLTRPALREALAPMVDPALRHHALHVLLEGQRRLGLTAVELEHARDRPNVHQRAVERRGARALVGDR